MFVSFSLGQSHDCPPGWQWNNHEAYGQTHEVYDFCYAAGVTVWYVSRADSRLAPSQWETSLQSNAVSHWLGANLESTPCILLNFIHWHILALHKVLLCIKNHKGFHNGVCMYDKWNFRSSTMMSGSLFRRVYVGAHAWSVRLCTRGWIMDTEANILFSAESGWRDISDDIIAYKNTMNGVTLRRLSIRVWYKLL